MINIRFKDNKYEVWSDTKVTPFDGRCIGSSEDKFEALCEARIELENEIQAIKEELKRG